VQCLCSLPEALEMLKLYALKEKATVRDLRPHWPFLNWIGLDHVASLVEIHLQVMYLGVGQIHVDTSNVVSNPAIFLTLLSQHKVTRTVAPHFFLARLGAVLKSQREVS
jgi:hypothetical protein